MENPCWTRYESMVLDVNGSTRGIEILWNPLEVHLQTRFLFKDTLMEILIQWYKGGGSINNNLRPPFTSREGNFFGKPLRNKAYAS